MMKNLDQMGRIRNRVVGFRVSDGEWEMINRAVRLSGHNKQDYIMSKLLNKDVVVEKSPRTYKALKDQMEAIIAELKRLENAGDCTEEFLETVKFVTSIYIATGGGNPRCK